MIHRRQLLIGAVLALAVSLNFGHARASGADDFIRAAGEKTFQSLGKELSEEERMMQFRKILLETFDLPTIARFTLGRYWRIASKKQRADYVDLFEEFIVQAYSHRFKDLSGQTFEVKNSHEINSRDQLVLSEIKINQGKPPVRVNWRVRLRDDAYRVIDVVVDIFLCIIVIWWYVNFCFHKVCKPEQ